MKEKVLVIQRDANVEKIPLSKERLVIGRDSNCDVVWKEAEFSREHVAIHNKHEVIYIENISTGGSVKINNKDSEYAELREGMEVVVGPYILKWVFQNVMEKLEDDHPGVQSQSGARAFSDGGGGRDPIEATQPSADPNLMDNLPALESTLQSDSGDIEMSPEVAAAIAEDDTVTQIASSVGMLKITTGEIVGREIRLEHGKEWIVGRARECHISVDNPKLSRHHFRILQIGAGFRVQDLDSSYGVKINGVSVKDAPIKSFDVITAGPVEMNFVIIDKDLKEIPDVVAGALSAPVPVGSLPALLQDDGGAAPTGSPNANIHSERTNYVPALNSAAPSNFQFSKPSLENSNSQGNFVSVDDPKRAPLPKDQLVGIMQRFKDQPPLRKILFILVPLLGMLALLANFMPEAPKPKVIAKKVEPKPKETPEDNPAQNAETTPEFQAKSKVEQQDIQRMYAEAERARDKGDWQKAYDLAKKVSDKAGKYKRTSDILSEAAAYITDLQIATLSRSDADTENAAAAAKQKVEELLQQAETAMKEKRWEDAQEMYSRALLLDPKNENATRGQYAAIAKDSSALEKPIAIEKTAAPIGAIPPPPPPPAPAEPTQAETIEAMSQDYQNAKLKIQEGAYRDALPVLADLKSQVERMIADDEATRSPAALISEDKRNMRAKIMESLDLINDQFVLEHKTSMDDAQQAIANQKYVEARAIYDTIIKREPLFEEPRIEREKLYKKMMADGQTAYREGLVSESVGDLSTAMELYEKSKSYFESINKKEAEEYYSILDKKLRVLRK